MKKAKAILNTQVVPNLFSKPKDKLPNSSFRMIDLFAGIGGIRLGFESVGGECVFTSEWDKSAQKTYQENFGEVPHGDITKINPEEIPQFDVLLAGFPCQPFSQAGKKMGMADTRGTLFFDIANILNHHRPRAVLLENVKRFKTHDEGRTFTTVKNTLEELGYRVHAQVLNAKDFGVPQNRERIYIVGLLGDYDFNFPKPTAVNTKVGDILDKKIPDKYTISDKLWAGHQRRKKEHQDKGNGFGYSMFNNASKYTSTISARYYKDGSEILIEQKGKNPRKLTPREAARLQGYPESFIIPVSDAQAYKQFGNSVAVPVIAAIAKEVAKALPQIKIKSTKNLQEIDVEKIKKTSIREVLRRQSA